MCVNPEVSQSSQTSSERKHNHISQKNRCGLHSQNCLPNSIFLDYNNGWQICWAWGKKWWCGEECVKLGPMAISPNPIVRDRPTYNPKLVVFIFSCASFMLLCFSQSTRLIQALGLRCISISVTEHGPRHIHRFGCVRKPWFTQTFESCFSKLFNITTCVGQRSPSQEHNTCGWRYVCNGCLSNKAAE